jgi:hypothetical protein
VGFFDDAKEFFGSGTLVRYRGRLFVATADHVAEQVQRRFRNVTLFHASGSDRRGPRIDHKLASLRVKVQRRAGTPLRVDVAAIEFPSTAARELTSMEFTEVENISSSGRGTEAGTNVWVVGTPAAVRGSQQGIMRNENLETFGVLLTHIHGDACSMAEHERDGRELGYGSPPEKDIHIQWTKALWPTGQWDDLPEAGGMSGGGVWSCRVDPSQVWSPERALLLGISWFQRLDLDCIRAVPMSEWLDLADAVVNDLPPP